jgi:hypothetical protein
VRALGVGFVHVLIAPGPVIGALPPSVPAGIVHVLIAGVAVSAALAVTVPIVFTHDAVAPVAESVALALIVPDGIVHVLTAVPPEREPVPPPFCKLSCQSNMYYLPIMHN